MNINFFKLNAKYLFLSFVLFVFYFSLLFYYNNFEAYAFKYDVNYKVSKIYDTIRRSSPLYLNTTMKKVEKGVYFNNGVSTVVDNTDYVRDLSDGINLLDNEIRRYTNDDFWSFIVLEKLSSNTNIAHFKPLREVHLRLNEKSKTESNWIDRILINENMSETYQAFSQCDLKFTEPYVEDISNITVRSVFYPLFENKELRAIFLFDIKAGIFETWVNSFNKRKFTMLGVDNSAYALNFISNEILLPCTPIDNRIVIYINLTKLMLLSFLLSFITIYLFILSKKLYINFLSFSKLDHMTGLLRRDFYEAKIERIYGKCLLIVDIDKFKSINDIYGHSIGDLVISEVCLRLRNIIDKQDVGIRWGGEEFVFILTERSGVTIFEMAEKMRKIICEEKINNIDVSISIGAVFCNKMPFKEALKLADIALYESKNSGRNKTTVSTGGSK